MFLLSMLVTTVLKKKADSSTRKRKKSLGLTNLHADLPAVRVAGPMLPPFPSPMPAAPRLEVHRGNEVLQDVSLPQPCAPCQQFILCPFVEHRKEGDFQAQVELLFAKRRQDGGSALRGFFGCPASRPTVSLPVHPWNATSCPSQQVRSMNNAWGVCGLALAPFQILRTANFFVQCSLLLMLAAQTARVPSLWCHPSPTDGSLFLSLWHLPEIRWLLSPGDMAYCQELKEDAVTRKKRKGLGLTDLQAVLRVVKIAGPRLPPPLSDALELCRARRAVPRLEERSEVEHVQDLNIPLPWTTCMQFILCPLGGGGGGSCRKEGDFQAQVQLIFAKEGRAAAVLSPQGDALCFNLEFWISLIRANRVRALYISLPMHSWNEASCPSQQLRSADKIWGESGLSLASCQELRNANFAVQCSLLLMLAARAARLLALWCHPSGMDGSSAPSLWQLLELSWVINNGSFCEGTIDHCAFSIARRRWRMPITVICTNLPGFNDVVECHPSRFRCEGGHQHPRKKKR